MRRPGADDLGEAADADAHQLAALALLGLLLAEPGVVDDVHRLLERGPVVARVVRPAGRRLVRELLGLDEVLHPELGRILADVVGQDVDHPLDGVDRLGHPERAAVGDAAGRLVGVDAVDLDERVGEVVRAGDDVEQPGRELRRIGGRAMGGRALVLLLRLSSVLLHDRRARGRRAEVLIRPGGLRVRVPVVRLRADPRRRVPEEPASARRATPGQDVRRARRPWAAGSGGARGGARLRRRRLARRATERPRGARPGHRRRTGRGP